MVQSGGEMQGCHPGVVVGQRNPIVEDDEEEECFFDFVYADPECEGISQRNSSTSTSTATRSSTSSLSSAAPSCSLITGQPAAAAAAAGVRA